MNVITIDDVFCAIVVLLGAIALACFVAACQPYTWPKHRPPHGE